MNFTLLCPITMEIFSEPVICSDGFTYEQTAIEKWLKDNNTSPMTGLVLENKNLIPNRIVKSLISENQDYMFNKIYNNIKYKIIDYSKNYINDSF